MNKNPIKSRRLIIPFEKINYFFVPFVFISSKLNLQCFENQLFLLGFVSAVILISRRADNAVCQICENYRLDVPFTFSMEIEEYSYSAMHDLRRAHWSWAPSREFFALSITECANFACSNFPLIWVQCQCVCQIARILRERESAGPDFYPRIV
jgi:hypothetical protein